MSTALLCALLGAAAVPLAPGIELSAPAEGQPEWTEALKAELRLGLEALPPGLRRPPGGTLSLALHAEPSDWGMGDGGPALPEWTGALQTFHLYAFREGADPRAAARTAALSPAEREALWRRRAVVHAVLRRWDEARGLSRADAWERAADWVAQGPYNTYAWAFSRSRGRASRALDLATFAEELYVPAESLRAGALPPDDQLRCQELSKARALTERLAALGLAEPAPRGSCPAFERWSRPGELSHLEVLFVAATDRPESLFGHMMLRPVFRPGPDAVEAPGFGTVVQLSAWVDPRHGPLEYLWRGLTGGYTTVVSASPAFLALEPVRSLEQRSVRRFRLQLTDDGNQRLMERVWELERRGYFQYRFFSDNCATVLLRLLNVALDDAHQVRVRNPVFVAPTAMLDALARLEVAGPDGVPRALLVPVGGAHLSSSDLAVVAEARREAAARSLGASLGPLQAQRLAELHALTRSPRTPERAGAYRALVGVCERALAQGGAEVPALVYGYLRDAVLVEKALLDVLEARRQAQLPAAPLAADFDAAAVLRDRQRFFESEASKPPHQEGHARASPPEVLEAEDEAAFEAAAAALGALTDGPLGALSATQERRREEAARADAEAGEARAGLPRSGWTRLSAGGGAARTPRGDWVAVVALKTALLLEELGEPLQHAYSPTTEVAVLAIELRVQSGPTGAALAGESLTVLRYRTLSRALPQTAPVLPLGLGWGAALHFDDARDLGLSPRFALGGELLASNAASEAPARRLFLVSAGGELQVRPTVEGVRAALAPRVALSHRAAWGAQHFDAVKAELAWSPVFVLGGAPLHEVRARLEATFLLPRLLGFRWLLRPEVRAGFAVAPGAAVEPGLAVTAALEAL